MIRTLIILAAIAGLSSSALAEGRPLHSGYAVEFHLSSQTVPFGSDGDLVPLAQTQGGLFLGYKICPWTFGVSFDLSRISSSVAFGSDESSQATTSLLIMPGVRMTALKSRDGRVELFGALDVGYGFTALSDDNDTGDEPTLRRLVYQVGPGLRYWAHKNFAFGVVAGLRGDFTTSSQDQPDDFSASLGVTSTFATLQVKGVF